mmetsp:Transcript_16868/g.42550  ORF Transcript_16868/g.42550 Transcript_16868/m.42550 type:complete len:165 (+) Transcript_16868:800-1294(+)
MVFAGVIWTKLFGNKAVVRTHYVDKDHVQQRKAQAEGVSFVSTNDVVTSELLNFPHLDVGSMALNFRGKLPQLEHTDAGNYQNVLVYGKGDAASPSLVRQSVSIDLLRCSVRHSEDLTTRVCMCAADPGVAAEGCCQGAYENGSRREVLGDELGGRNVVGQFRV